MLSNYQSQNKIRRKTVKIVVASSNQGKIKEIKSYWKEYEVVGFSELLEPFEIEETEKTFAGNAVLKAEAISKKLKDEYLIIADDSGITVPALGNIPGIYSARFAGAGASDRDNLEKLIETLKENSLKETPAFYTCAIAMSYQKRVDTVHGWMHGKVIDTPKGANGFGYDPMFIPEGFDATLGELEASEKMAISHRTKALALSKKIISAVARLN